MTIKILFQGDSITDGGRNRSDHHNLGESYPKYAAELIKKHFPEVEFEFINLGIAGNRTDQLFDRFSRDCIDLQPDIVSILIGNNDVGQRYNQERIPTTDAQFELNYKCILERVKNETNAKILMLQPVIEGEHMNYMRPDLEKVILLTDSLADKYADAYVKNYVLIHSNENYGKPNYFTQDGAHPNECGARFIAKHYLEKVKPLIDEIIAK